MIFGPHAAARAREACGRLVTLSCLGALSAVFGVGDARAGIECATAGALPTEASAAAVPSFAIDDNPADRPLPDRWREAGRMAYYLRLHHSAEEAVLAVFPLATYAAMAKRLLPRAEPHAPALAAVRRAAGLSASYPQP